MSKGTLRVRITGDKSGLEKTLKGATGSLKTFAKAGGVGVAGAAAGAAAGIGGSIKAFADFDASMTKSLAIMGDVSKGMRKDMSDAAREVGKTTSFSAKQAADSYFFLASAGLDAKESIEALPQVAAFAQAGMFDMSTATDLATDAQSALGMTSDNTKENIRNLARTTDVFVAANTLANASVEEFATSMTRKAGAALQNVNKDIEEGTAILAVFADQGLKGERAGTALANTLMGLSERSRQSSEKFRELGVKVFDAEGNMRNMSAIIGDLETGMEGMTTQQREATLASLGFNKQTREGILALLGNSGALREYEAELRNAGGTAKEVADKQLDTFWKQLGLLKDQVIDVGISVGNMLMPHLRKFVGWVQDNMPAIKEFTLSVMDSFISMFAAVKEWWVETAKPAIDAFRAAIDENWPAIKEAGQSLMDMFSELGDLAGTIFRSVLPGSVGDGTGQSKESMNSMSDEIGRLADDVSRAASAIEVAARGMGSTWNLVVGGVTGDFQQMNQGLNDATEGRFSATMDRIGTLARTMAVTIRTQVNRVVTFFQELPGRITSAIGNLAGRLKSIGAQAINGLIAGLTSRLRSALSTVRNIASKIISAARSAFDVRSPSKEFEKIGVQIGAGLDAGILAGLADMQATRELNSLVGGAQTAPGPSAVDTGGGLTPRGGLGGPLADGDRVTLVVEGEPLTAVVRRHQDSQARAIRQEARARG